MAPEPQRVFTSAADCPARPRVVAIGNFDGVHRGHRAVLAAGRRLAGEAGVGLMVCTFDPAPTAVLAPDRHQPRICGVGERVRLLLEAGADEVLLQPFDLAFSQREAAWFVGDFLCVQLRAAGVVVGHDFRFGRGRAADAAALGALIGDRRLLVVPAFEDGGVISSSRIRRLVAAGEVGEAARLLGRPHRIEGEIVHGDARGRTIGFPTANLDPRAELIPADGVYACVAAWGGGRWRAVVNLGVRPTFGGLQRRIEAHLPGWSGDLYGQAVSLEFHARLRGERRFDGIEALKAQIRLDTEQAMEALAGLGPAGGGAGA